MKSVIFIRHGKSSWDYEVADTDRPLKERGITDAQLIGRALKSEGIMVDRAYSSPANRALHTAMLVLRQTKFSLQYFRVVPELYDFSGEGVLQFLKSRNNSLNTILIFGHNYAFTTLVNTLGDTYIDNVPTAGMVHIQFETDNWAALHDGKTVKTIFPKQLR